MISSLIIPYYTTWPLVIPYVDKLMGNFQNQGFPDALGQLHLFQCLQLFSHSRLNWPSSISNFHLLLRFPFFYPMTPISCQFALNALLQPSSSAYSLHQPMHQARNVTGLHSQQDPSFGVHVNQPSIAVLRSSLDNDPRHAVEQQFQHMECNLISMSSPSPNFKLFQNNTRISTLPGAQCRLENALHPAGIDATATIIAMVMNQGESDMMVSIDHCNQQSMIKWLHRCASSFLR